MEKVYVYRHHKLTNDEVFYVGIGVGDRPYVKTGRNNLWNKIVNKHGYRVEIVQECDNREDACELETFLIELYGRLNNKTGQLCNMTDGGEGISGYNFSEEIKQKISNSQKGKQTWLGKKHSEETKQKISHYKKGRKNTEKNRGENHGHCKLSETDIIWIRENYIKGCNIYGQNALSRKFNVSTAHIFRIVNNKLWTHLLPEKK